MHLNEILNQLKSVKMVDEFRRGIEKESLRVNQKGLISKEPHFEKLGAALTHPYITTDYSEALLEFVTPVFKDPVALLKFLEELHIFTLSQMGDEVLWANSMPCFFKKDDIIPIAQYGTSNVGRMKTIYRNGLSHRYGSAMQVISGIHFNFSLTDSFFEKLQSIKSDKGDFQEFKSNTYMNAIRNIHQYSWLVPYLFGSSPVICKSFLSKSPTDLDLINFDDQGTLTFEGATSLRLSNLGYTNATQKEIAVCYNNLDTYVKGLRQAITSPNEDWAKIGLKENDVYKQLNNNNLQLENEYYGEVRPKRPIRTGESPTNALLDRGIEYIELRSVDVNTFSPIGIELDQVLFLDVLLSFCLLENNETLCPIQTKKFRANQEMVARHGRLKELQLFNGQEEIKARDWAKSALLKLSEIAEHLDVETGNNDYIRVVQKYGELMVRDGGLSSSRLLTDMKDKNETFFRNTLNRSIDYSNEFKNKKLSSEKEAELKELTKSSIAKQKEIESNDVLSLDDYLEKYFKQNL